MSPPLRLTADLVSRFLGWCRSQPAVYDARQLRSLDLNLDWWVFCFTDRDMRTVTSAEVRAALTSPSTLGEGKRLVALGLLYKYLRAERLVEATVDPTAGVVAEPA